MLILQMEPAAKFGIQRPLDFQGIFGCSNRFIKRGGPPHFQSHSLQSHPLPRASTPSTPLSCPFLHTSCLTRVALALAQPCPCRALPPHLEPSDPSPETCPSAPRPIPAVPPPPLQPTASAAAAVAAQTRDCRALV